jgi:sugar porter (SP) family MFS transporter
MIGCYQLAVTIGIVCAYSVNYILIQHHAWRSMFASSAIPAAILVIGIFFLPESPRWLMSVGKRAEAISSLMRLRGKEYSEQELLDIETTLAKEPGHTNWRPLFSKPLLPVLLLGVMLFCLQQLSGINVVIYYAPQIFRDLGFPSESGQILATMGIGLVNVFVTVLALIYIDKIGRRNLLLFGFAGTFLSLGMLAIFSFYDLAILDYLSVICLVLYITSFAISLGPIPYVIMAEIFPLHVRGAGMGFSSMSNWGFNGIVVFTYPLLYGYFGIQYTLGIYSLICLFGLFYTWAYMPETKNLSLETIENHVMSGRPLNQLGRNKGIKS